MSDPVDARRQFLITAGTAGAGLLLAAVDPGAALAAEKREKQKKGKEKEVGAVEDLMREHSVLRRALLVYRESAARLRSNPGSIDPQAIAKTAKLFRSFGEDYHERRLEEAHIFPAVRKAGGPAAAYVDCADSAAQSRSRNHRLYTRRILAVTGKGAIGTGDIDPLARVFDSLDLMYENHAAREDTIVFPAWKDVLSERQLEEMGDKFEDIEREQFGKDGFEDFVAQISQIEQMLGFADLAQFTAPPPPKA